MIPLGIGKRVCTMFDGRARYGEIVAIGKSGHYEVKFEDEPDITYKMRPGELYVVGAKS